MAYLYAQIIPDVGQVFPANQNIPMSLESYMRRLAIAVATIGACVLVPSTQAQSGGNQPQLEEVTITAQRKVENLQDAAIPVDVALAEELSQLGVTDVTLLGKISPAFTAISGGGSNNVFFIRGVGNFSVNAYTDPAVAFNLDGVYIGRPSATTAVFLDVQRVEVLKGPQGILYGRNATAGAVNVIPNVPVLGETEGHLSAEVGNYGTWGGEAVLNLPLGESWAARLAAGKLENNGYNDDGTDQTDDAAFRAQLLGDFSDSVSVRLAFDYSTTDGTGNGPTFLGNYAFNLGSPSGDPNNVPGYNFIAAPANVSAAHTGALTPAAAAYYGSLLTTPAFTTPAPMLYPFLDNDYWGILAEFNIDLGWGNLVFLPAYRKADIDVVFNNPGFQAAFNQENHEQTSLEARLSTVTGPVDWIFGAYYFDETVDGLASFNQQSLQSTQVIDDSSTRSLAFFANGTFNMTDQWRLVGGLRWTDDKKSFDARADVFLDLCIRDLPIFPGGPEIPNCVGAPVVPAGLTVEDTLAQINPDDLPLGPPGIGTGPVPYGQIPLFPGAPPPVRSNLLFLNPAVVDRTQKTDEVTYRVALEYDATPENLLYASYATGYRSGGFSITNGREEYDPEFLDALTLGSKNRFMDNRLQLNAEFFYWWYKDMQDSFFGADGNGQTAFYTDNIGKSTIKGFEINALFAATDSTQLRGTVQYLDTKIKEFSFIQQTPDEAVRPVTGCATDLVEVKPDGNALWNVDCAGQELKNSPKWSVNLGVDQNFDIGSWWATASFDARYRDKRWVGFGYTPPQLADAVTTFDTSLQVGTPDGKWSFFAYVRNITDKDIRSLTQVFGSMSNLVSTVYEPPRTYGIRINYNF